MKEEFVKAAIKESYKARKKDNVPVGAIIVKNNKIIAKAHNLRESSGNVMDHAEISCIKRANRKLRDWRLDGCDMYVTLEPCKMCREVIVSSRIKKVYYLTNKGSCGNGYNTEFVFLNDNNEMHKVNNEVLLRSFFKKMRQK